MPPTDKPALVSVSVSPSLSETPTETTGASSTAETLMNVVADTPALPARSCEVSMSREVNRTSRVTLVVGSSEVLMYCTVRMANWK